MALIRRPLPYYAQQKAPDPRETLSEETGKLVITWEPPRKSDIQVELAGCILYGLPETIDQETDPKGRIILALLGEILGMQERIEFLTQQAQGKSLKGQALASKDAATAAALRQQAEQAAASAAAPR